jgi:hypothetical protein
MNRSLAAALAVAATVMLPAAALAQGVFPPPPPTGAQGVFPPPPQPAGNQDGFPAPPPTGSQGVFPTPGGRGPSQASAPGGFGPPQGGGGFGGPPQSGGFGGPPQGGAAICANFPKLKDEAEVRGRAIQEAAKSHDRKVMCGAVTHFVEQETKVVKFLVDNQTACGVPQQAVAGAKASHQKTVEFRDRVCAEAPPPKPPSLSDALGTPTLDTAKNTKTGKGTLDSLTGNPLAH